MEGYQNSRPGLQVVQTLCTASGPGSAALAAQWASQYGFNNAQAWGDTTDYFYTTWMSQAPFGGGYPGHMVVDLDTMTYTAGAPGGPNAAASAIQAILDADHPCADY